MKAKNLAELSGQELRSKGERLREEDKYDEALQYLTLAIVAYQKEGNYRGLIDALKDRCLTWKHLFLLTNSKAFAILTQKDAEAMLAIAQGYDLKDKLNTSFFKLGEAAQLFDNHMGAIKFFKKALEVYVGPLAERGDYRYHLGEAQYRNGQKNEGRKNMLRGLKEIRQGAGELDPFYIHVWESGVHKRLAELLSKDEPEEAKKHYQEAKRIAEADPKLVIRRRQIVELGKQLSFD